MPRIAGVEIPDNKPLRVALRYIYGVGPKFAEDVVSEAGLDGQHAHQHAGDLVVGHRHGPFRLAAFRPPPPASATLPARRWRWNRRLARPVFVPQLDDSSSARSISEQFGDTGRCWFICRGSPALYL